jgi:DNA-binding NarL/FixJ family response regulator
MTEADRAVIRILVADDHVPTRDHVREVLAGHDRFEICAETADAATTIQQALRERPDLCLLDVHMPGSGLAAVWEIKARLPDVKIVMLTDSDEDSDIFAAVRSGADGYLLKTMNLGRLPDTLLGVCSGEAALQRTHVARLLRLFRQREPRWRTPLDIAPQWRLTSREWEILELLTRERTTSEIARQLVISQSAVRVHIASIMRKLQVSSRSAAVELFRQRSGS